MSGVFISYRREDSQDVTGRIFDYLTSHFKKNKIFKDVDSIPPGVDFRDVINTAIDNSAVMLVIIGNKWLDVKNQDGGRRLDDPGDFVRLEIETALQKKIPVLPVLLGDTKNLNADQLPESLRGLAFLNSMQVRPDPDFRGDVKRLYKGLERFTASRPLWKTTGGRLLLSLILVAGIIAVTQLVLKDSPTVTPEKKASDLEKRKTPLQEESGGSSTSSPGQPFDTAKYYKSAKGKSGRDLKNALIRLTQRGHREITYKEAEKHTANLHEDRLEKDKILIFYDYELVSKDSFNSKWNREHIWPKSYGVDKSMTSEADLFNIVPADMKQNSDRSNLPFTDTQKGGMYLIRPERQGDIRGDLARIFFYMAVRYEGFEGEPDLELTDDPLKVNEMKFGPLSTLLRWHKEDGVSLDEKTRNNRIFKIQGNRNPFVDNPEYVGLIWDSQQ